MAVPLLLSGLVPFVCFPRIVVLPGTTRPVVTRAREGAHPRLAADLGGDAPRLVVLSVLLAVVFVGGLHQIEEAPFLLFLGVLTVLAIIRFQILSASVFFAFVEMIMWFSMFILLIWRVSYKANFITYIFDNRKDNHGIFLLCVIAIVNYNKDFMIMNSYE